eukprot:CAMPEP_0184371182 /NCGR_PEP_ID=MMETSP1089-20130417/163252_1 /TAXON_ID=38269 ORGANISM="Gloeochaete wittrockiana, Strain SAG46.84" /NCGR_SAMPLE_ID=MMETSP1089 /ASSEMBLY_ACC=CAM_ASM_000445 /LENGTH=42 /DNA_ID= /DNA_START= /DNA_END= /DNA_ORIENTATION=
MTHSTAFAISTSSNTTIGLLPPNSRVTFLMSAAHAAMIFEPV